MSGSPATLDPREREYTARGLRYFASHGIDPQLAHECGVSERNGAIIWPTVDVNGNYWPRRRRLWDGPGPKVRPIFTGRSPGCWWPLGRPAYIAPTDDVLVCEGESDAMAVTSLRLPGLHVVEGKAAKLVTLAAELQTVGARVAALGFDGDLAGGQLADQTAQGLVKHGIGARILAVPHGCDLAAICAGIETPDGLWPSDIRGWLSRELLQAWPVGLTEAALIAENDWLRARLLAYGANHVRGAME